MRVLRWFWHMRRAWQLRASGERHVLKAQRLFGRAKAHEDRADGLYTPKERGDQ